MEREKEVTGYVEFLLVAAERPSTISANDGAKILPLSLGSSSFRVEFDSENPS